MHTLLRAKINTSYESWINKLSIDVWFVMIGRYLSEIQLFENLRVQKKIAFKVVQIKFLAMHTINQKWSWYIYGKKCRIYLKMEHDLYLMS